MRRGPVASTGRKTDMENEFSHTQKNGYGEPKVKLKVHYLLNVNGICMNEKKVWKQKTPADFRRRGLLC